MPSTSPTLEGPSDSDPRTEIAQDRKRSNTLGFPEIAYDAGAMRCLSVLPIRLVAAGLAAAVITLAMLGACKVKDPPPIREEWTDTFERDAPGASYYSNQGEAYTVRQGALNAKGAKNHPLWLRRKIPRDVRIELDVWSTESRGDIKIEVFGDGHSYDPDGGAYTATGYELVFGGWFNSKSIIARLDEHGKDVVQRTEPKVIANRHYHWKIERRATQLTWYVDDMTTPFLQLTDPQPLEGMGHDYLGFNNWETDTWFDNLVISPL